MPSLPPTQPSPDRRILRFALVTGTFASALFAFHALEHRCLCGHLAHETFWPRGSLDLVWIALFLASLVAVLRTQGSKFNFLVLLLILLFLGELFILPVLGIPLLYYQLCRKAKPLAEVRATETTHTQPSSNG